MLNSERLMELKDLLLEKQDLLTRLDPECPSRFEFDATAEERAAMRLEVERIQARINLLSRARGANQ